MTGSSLPSALDRWEEITSRIEASPLALFLDYDGTLTKIAPRPQDATLDPAVREQLSRLAKRVPVAIITGRALSDIQTLVGLPELFYAGSHGFDIFGPDNVRFQPDERLPQLFAEVTEALRPTVEQIPGIVMESKGFSIALHYRLSPPERVPELEAAIDRLVASREGLRKTYGKKLFEVRPTLDWHKGSSVTWLIDHFADRRMPLFIGDDRTDEDALAVVADGGIGIFVGEPQWETAASYRLEDPAEVASFLGKLEQAKL